MLHACDQRFDVIGNFKNFCELNKALAMKQFASVYEGIRNHARHRGHIYIQVVCAVAAVACAFRCASFGMQSSERSLSIPEASHCPV